VQFTTSGFELHQWQQEAVKAWVTGDERGPYRGTLEVFTGGGKTLIALSCMAEAARIAPDLRLAVVVPTEALARQWMDVLGRSTTLRAEEIGLLGAGGRATFERHRAVVAVLNTAAKQLPELPPAAHPLMLIVDECHRAGAPSFARVLKTDAKFRLGLSATPDRDEFDEDGETVRYDDQLVGRALGSVVYSFSLRDARRLDWLPDYEIHHHGIKLHPAEQSEYDAISRKVDDLADQLRLAGGDVSRARHLTARQDELGATARSYVALTSKRKDQLYHATERQRVATQIVSEALAKSKDRRILLFHERVSEAIRLYSALCEVLPRSAVALEHFRLPSDQRTSAVARFRNGKAQVLVSVKSLIEGLDVPDADMGVSVASSSSIRQRIQSLGRVLRRQFDETSVRKEAQMHVIYVAGSVDELIYAKEDWSDLTGEAANHYWLWSLDLEGPVAADGPPASPRPTEDQEWDRLGGRPPVKPVPWLGPLVGQEYSIDTLGTVTNSAGSIVVNAASAIKMVAAVRDRPGGRFRVTPEHQLVLAWRETTGRPELLVAGQLPEPLRIEDAPDEQGTDAPAGTQPVQLAPPGLQSASVVPGSRYPGPTDKAGGTFKLRQKGGGVIERRRPGAPAESEFALADASGDPREANARRVLKAWRQLFDRGIPFSVNQVGDAWYVEGGERRFLAHVPGGFKWPSSATEE